MTETTAVGTRGYNTQEFHKYSSIGLLAPNMQAKVVDWNSRSFLPPGYCGELWLRGPAIMQPLADLEAILISHPEILDAAVTAESDEVFGEIPVTFVVRRYGSRLTEEDVKDFVAKQVSPYKKIRKVVFTSSIPKSAAGKILRRELRKLLNRRL
ncbi:hypothetical protein V6N13_087794 [Hibiscus sabdariffa]|uniref:4-coumarate--CoA ligase n=1 Tax=Hibiscus sabdariffa TaxID=183260 RepID=A0ABR2FY80_9ROSI